MKVIDPVAVTAAMLTASSVLETDNAAWAVGTAYALGDRVVAAHRVFESAIGGNVGHDPSTDGGIHWTDVGPTNRWAMFDLAAGPFTQAADEIEVTIAPAVPVSAVALVDLAASSVRVRVVAGAATIYDQTTLTAGSTSASFLDLPAVAGQSITVTADAAGGTAMIGKIAIGDAIDIGQTETGPTVGITDYSRRETDDFGVTTVVERAWAKQITVRARLSSDDVDAVERQLAALRATPTIWIGEEGFESLTAYGFFKDFSIDLQLGATSFCSLTIEGMPTADIPVAAGDPAVDGVSDISVIDPIVVTDDVLASSSVAETDAPVWSAVTNYSAGNRVIKPGLHRVFESLTDANVGHDPAVDTAHWMDIGATNRWAMFDQALGSATMADGSIVVSLTPAAPVSALAVLDTSASTVRVQASGYDRTIAVDSGESTNVTMFLDLDLAAGDVVTVTMAAGDPEQLVSVGTLLFGLLLPLGVIATSPTIGITDYSLKTTDDFGNTVPVERAWAKRMVISSMVSTGAVDSVMRQIAKLRAKPALWIGQEDFSSLTIYGFFKDFSVALAATTSICSVTIEGLSTAAPAPAPLPRPVIGWSEIVDDDGTKPADNATVGTPPGTPMGTRPVDDVLADITTAQANIADLFATYGDTESAANSATDANAAKLAAQAASGTAATAAGTATDQAAIASTLAASAQASSNLSASYANIRGVTPNGSLDAGTIGWYDTVGTAAPNPAGPFTSHAVATYQGRANVIVSGAGVPLYVMGPIAAIDTSRQYRMRLGIYSPGGAGTVYAGLSSRDATGASTGANTGIGYPLVAGLTLTAGWHDIVSDVITGEDAASYFAFRVGAKKAAPVVLMNYNSTAGAVFGVDYCYIEDVTESEAAGSQAGIATGQAAIATSQAAAAQQNAVIAAQVGSGDANLNSMFSNWPSPTGFPATWTNNSGVVAGVNLTRVAGITSSYAARVAGAAGSQALIDQHGASSPWTLNVGSWIVLEADVLLNAGALTGAGLLFRCSGSADIVLNMATDKDVTDTVVGAGVAEKSYTFRKLVKVTAGGNTSSQFYCCTHWSGLGSIAAANDITWYRAGWRYASAAEIKTGQIDSLSAAVTSQSGAIADLQNKTATAYVKTTASVPGAEATVEIVATTSDGSPASAIAFNADAIRLGNGNLPAMDVVGGDVRIYGDMVGVATDGSTTTTNGWGIRQDDPSGNWVFGAGNLTKLGIA